MQNAIWREYRPDQEDDKRPSLAYLVVQQRAIGEVVFKPYDEAAAHAAAPYLLHAHELRLKLIEMGERDPLDGLTPLSELENTESEVLGKRMDRVESAPLHGQEQKR